MIFKLSKIVHRVSYYSGLNCFLGKFLDRKLFCVGYHSISDRINKKDFSGELYPDLSIERELFEKQIIFLKSNGHTFINFRDLNRPEIRRIKKPTIIFFDDGFKDVLINAQPILKKHNISAAIFITTGLIERSHFLWTLKLRYYLLQKGLGQKEVEAEVRKFKSIPLKERNKKLEEPYRTDNFIINPSNFKIFLGWDEVKILSENNFEIGSHSVSHQKFTELTSEDLKRELAVSKKVLEEKTGKEIEAVSYPYGRFNEKTMNLAKTAGYRFGVSAITGVNNLDNFSTCSYRIKRISPFAEDDLIDFRARVYIRNLLK